ncbi:choice-of-anchor D domain-containing protein [Adhaeribacter swui]|uniref:Choice-of-anchor D domain-containing protein n=1 Tax=Adhaeribacter swui TaxID=2086471 RepID=A0A7G7GCZ4_9BACT|nr:malectin domain-containing carbohydrate-binding protein [Adhaeribacter swui]QNF35028.1 choice-of-anchor D domain-containing protein [Adhaeribacter swui]
MKKNYTLISLIKSKLITSLVIGAAVLTELLSSNAAQAQTIAVQNPDNFPANDELVFSRIQYPWRRTNTDGTYTPYNENHDKIKLRISNKGTSSLTVSKLTLSNTAAWKVTPPKALPISIAAGSYIDVTVQFVAVSLDKRVKVVHHTLTIASNDKVTPSKVVQLHGLYQRAGEGNREPYAQEIINAFNFKSVVGFGHNDGTNDGTAVVPNSDEIISATFSRADASKPVTVLQIAAYHGCCASIESFKWYPKGSNSTTTLFTHNPLDGQSLLPRKRYSTTELAKGSFSPSGSFGFKVGTANSDRSKNFESRIGLRIWKVKNSSGVIVPNTYIIANDYLGTEATNYDYQDNLYYVTNIKPDAGLNASELAATPSSLDFGGVNNGGSKTLSVSLKNQAKSGGTSIKISSVALTGPNKGEFTIGSLSTTLAAQGSTSFKVNFKPSSQGIKNAALLVYHNGAGSPFRVPLYGIGNVSGTAINVVKRVKGAADANVTIAGKVWEADKNYRKGSIKLDSQVQPGPIAATDQDVLYQTYLSAATNLAETREEIPLAKGSYYVRLHFAENYFSADGARVFNIAIEGQTRLSNFDIHKEVGYRSALVKDFAVNVSDGYLSLKFNPTANRVALCGVEIFRAQSASSTSSSVTIEGNPMQEIQENTSLQLIVYPNPTSGDKVSVEATNLNPQEEITFTLFSQTGQTVEVKSAVADDRGTASTQLATFKPLNKGLYILQGRANSGQTQTKLIVE